ESTGLERQVGSGPKVALLDTGVKENQIRCLVQKGATVKTFPATAMAREILSWSPDGIVISNGPGDPAAIPLIAAATRTLVEAAAVPMAMKSVVDFLLDDRRKAVARK